MLGTVYAHGASAGAAESSDMMGWGGGGMMGMPFWGWGSFLGLLTWILLLLFLILGILYFFQKISQKQEKE